MQIKRILLSVLCVFAFYGAQARNETLSPDGRWVAYTGDDNNLYIKDNADGDVSQLTFDGSDLILNGYASWVYYEEIFGRPSRYKAFWWSPDSRKLAFYRFDNSEVPMFPIYSPFSSELNLTRYPKAGQKNPEVKVGIVDLNSPETIVWADFEESSEQYFGTPFWGADSRKLFVQWMPRVQQELRLYAVDAADGALETIYTEKYPTWVNWMSDMLFGKDGLYMVRDFETGWQQIYFLSYDGKVLRRLTEGENWRMGLVGLDEKKGDIYFTAYRHSTVHSCFYKLDRKGEITLLTDETKNVDKVDLAPDFKRFTVVLSDVNTPSVRYTYRMKDHRLLDSEILYDKVETDRPHYTLKHLTLSNGMTVPAFEALPKDFDPSKVYPVVIEVYGGPNTHYVRDRWREPSERALWYYNNGVIKVTADTRAAGHNGRAGVDMIYEDLVSVPVADMVEWAKYYQSLPYAGKIGVEGFSFGGTMTTMLVMTHPECFCCGIAGGGVYDWQLYDSHYTERFMNTPQNNPDGYERAKALNYVNLYDPSKSRLKLTHGTGDDNVHFQNTLQLIDALQRADKQFDLMIYPDGMHGYRGEQGAHDAHADFEFWNNYLKH